MNELTTRLHKTFSRLVIFSALLFNANIAPAQEQVSRLRSPAKASGVIGGESHASYVIRARKGRMMTIRISWKPDSSLGMGADRAEFYVSDSPNFGGDGAVNFGKESKDGKSWRGRIPKTGDYYIYVMGHPVAHYTLRVTIR